MQESKKRLSKQVLIINDLGIHARPAGMIAKLAKHAKSRVWIAKGEKQADALSIIDILTLVCAKGEKLTIRVDDPLDIHILNKLVILVESGFGE